MQLNRSLALIVVGTLATVLVDVGSQVSDDSEMAKTEETWQRRFEASESYGQFIRMALGAAQANDADAQYHIAAATAYCRYAKVVYKKDGRRPGDRYADDVSVTRELVARMQQHYDRCIDTVHNDPFADLPTAAHGYNFEYWLSQAASNGNVNAKLDLLTRVPAVDKYTDDEAAQRMRAAQLRETALLTIKSGDANAVGRLAQILEKAPNVNPDANWALSLVACGMGAVCVADPEELDRRCKARPDRCIPGGSMEDFVLLEIGQTRFGNVRVTADRLQQAIRQSDQAEIEKILFGR